MSHQTFKVSICINDTVENFYIKHYVDDFQPIFAKFKNLVFQRNPAINVSNLKVYWIDAENDQILISCEEDFRLFIEQGSGKKVFFNVKNGPQVQQDDDEETTLEAEEPKDDSKADRKSRKSAIRDEEKQKRAAKRLAEKMRNAEEKLRSGEKYERKNAERLERAKKRCEQIRQIIGSFDPANLSPSSVNMEASTSSAPPSAPPSIDESLALLRPSAETIRLLSNAIAGCLQPCNLINKILNEIIGMVPQPTAENSVPVNSSTDQDQQTIEIPRQNTATNTSDLNTPIVSDHPPNQEIEALFKEAAKELEKMNDIVNASKNGTTSGSLTSSTTGITQVERVFSSFTDSAISDATIVNNIASDFVDAVDEASMRLPDHGFNIVSPPKSLRSRESSIEIHDVNSIMSSDDSRDWTMLDAVNDQEDESMVQDSMPSKAQNTEQNFKDNSCVSEEKTESIKSVETQTSTPILSGFNSSSEVSQEQVQASVKMSIETAGKMNDLVLSSLASAQQSLSSIQVPVSSQFGNVLAPQIIPSAPEIVDRPKASSVPTLVLPSASTPANLMANRLSAGNQAPHSKPSSVGPAVIVYDPNPKINSSVNQMIGMGFSNEGGWLTQLLLNVDGDVQQAINFLTPQPKNKKN